MRTMLVLVAVLGLHSSDVLAGEPIVYTNPVYQPCVQPPPSPPCDADGCSNTPFQPTDCLTIETYPARANVVQGNALKSTNMLYCPPKGDYALCFFSGPTYATGNDPDTNNVLTCIPDTAKGIANCQCQLYHGSEYFVDINSILNLGAWYETTDAEVCGADGSKCKNIAVCDKYGQGDNCPDQVAPVCAYVDAQSQGDPSKSLYPKGDLVSTFSYAMGNTTDGGDYTLGSKACNGVYAGCMTAACTIPEDAGDNPRNGTVVNCACPLWNGDYEIGQNVDNCPEADARWVWSAAHSLQ